MLHTNLGSVLLGGAAATSATLSVALTIGFTYALWLGVLALHRSWVRSQAATRVLFGVFILTCITALFLSELGLAPPSPPSSSSPLGGTTSNSTAPVVRLHTLIHAQDAPFRPVAAAGHVLALIGGMLIGGWLADGWRGPNPGGASPAAAAKAGRVSTSRFAALLHCIFLAGSCLWFRSAFAPLFGLHGALAPLAPAVDSVSALDALLLGVSHTFAFYMGFLLIVDYTSRARDAEGRKRQGLLSPHVSSDAVLGKHYFSVALVLLLGPELIEAGLASLPGGSLSDHLASIPGLDVLVDAGAGIPDDAVAFYVRAVLAVLVFGVLPTHISLLWKGLALLSCAVGAVVVLLPFRTTVGTVTTLLGFGLDVMDGPVKVHHCLLVVLVLTLGSSISSLLSIADPDALPDEQDEARRARRLASYGPPYPNGWYHLCDSGDVLVGEVHPLHALGRDFVVFRGESGAVSVLDAICPHMGANIGYGGTVKGDSVECPFHLWQFDGDGACSHIPYSERIPPQAKVRSYYARDWSNMVVIWYDAEGREPLYTLEDMEETSVDGDWIYYGAYAPSTVEMHIAEFGENSADMQHFTPLHGEMRIPNPWDPNVGLKIPGITISHKADWKLDEDVSWKAYFLNHASLNFLGAPIPESGATATITFLGPGSIVHFRVATKLGDVLFTQTHLPLSPLKQRIRFSLYAEAKVPVALAQYVFSNWITQWKMDLNVWANKEFMKKPLLVQKDGPIKAMRKWYSQHLSESSSASTSLDW